MPPQPPESICLAEDNVWRYHIALNKFTGKITAAWITRSDCQHKLWLDGAVVDTQAQEPDFPFYAFSQPPIGHVATEEPPFSMFGYKCRKTDRLFIRRLQPGKLGPEVELKVGAVLGGITFAISGDKVLARVDLLKNPKIVPALIDSQEGRQGAPLLEHCREQAPLGRAGAATPCAVFSRLLKNSIYDAR